MQSNYITVEQKYPFIEATYFSFEKNFDSEVAMKFARDHYMLPFLICALYLALIFGGQKIMENRKPFKLQLPLASWNLFLALFSFIGVMRTLPNLLNALFSETFEDTVCRDPLLYYTKGTIGLWMTLFNYSKVFELLDTVFIVLRKRPLIFLHYYHHITVLLYCWFAVGWIPSTGMYFLVMNYAVHSIMYGYYYLMSIKIKPPIPAYSITLAQLLQMLFGTIVVSASAYYKLFEKKELFC